MTRINNMFQACFLLLVFFGSAYCVPVTTTAKSDATTVTNGSDSSNNTSGQLHRPVTGDLNVASNNTASSSVAPTAKIDVKSLRNTASNVEHNGNTSSSTNVSYNALNAAKSSDVPTLPIPSTISSTISLDDTGASKADVSTINSSSARTNVAASIVNSHFRTRTSTSDKIRLPTASTESLSTSTTLAHSDDQSSETEKFMLTTTVAVGEPEKNEINPSSMAVTKSTDSVEEATAVINNSEEVTAEDKSPEDGEDGDEDYGDGSDTNSDGDGDEYEGDEENKEIEGKSDAGKQNGEDKEQDEEQDGKKVLSRKHSGLKKPSNAISQAGSSDMVESETSSSAFFTNVVVVIVLIVCVYISYHNRQKLKAWIIEGRKKISFPKLSRGSYSRLSTRTDDILPSSTDAQSVKNYIY